MALDITDSGRGVARLPCTPDCAERACETCPGTVGDRLCRCTCHIIGDLADVAPVPLGDCPSCGRPIERVGAETWHARSYVAGVHPRDCLVAQAAEV